MLNLDPHWLVPVACLSSDRVLANLTSGALSPRLTAKTSWKASISLSVEDYKTYVGALLRKEDVNASEQFWGLHNNDFDVFELLSVLRSYFLQWHGDHFEVKAELLTEWLTFISLVDPAWIIGNAYIDLLETNILGFEQLCVAVGMQCPSALPKLFGDKPYADNHVHLNGHGHNSLSMLDFALYLTNKPTLDRQNWSYRPECSFFNSERLDLTQLPIMVNRLWSGLIAQTFVPDTSNTSIPQWSQLELSQFSTDLLVLIETINASTLSQRLIKTAHLSKISETGRWLHLVISLLSNWRNLSPTEQLYRHSCILACNLLRNYMIMIGVGLGSFVGFFGFKFRKPSSRHISYKKHVLLHDFADTHSREFRTSENILLKNNNGNLLLRPKELQYFANNIYENGADKRCHFVIHFSRRFPSGGSRSDRYLIDYRKNQLQTVRKIQDFFGSLSHGDYNLDASELCLERKRADLRALIRGFDVAGNENELPIEVFAPSLRVLRASKHETKTIFEKRLRKPFLTVHAGEDFNHILSGLRSIDETVEFCDFVAGDRLGHALALGIDVYAWAKRQAHVFLPISEHLDNLVWCYHQAIDLIQVRPEFQAALTLIENKIQLWAEYLYDFDLKPMVIDLHQAWMLRRNCPLHADNIDKLSHIEELLWLPDLKFLKNKQNSVPIRLWNNYLNRNFEKESKQSRRADEIVSVSFVDTCKKGSSIGLTDSVSYAELKLIHAVQDWMIEKYSKKKIVIEACPTSNIYIGRFEHYVEHPIFRWNPPLSDLMDIGEKCNIFGIRKGPLNVCINTDDAGLMPTTLENEYRILKEVAINHMNVSVLDAERWIDSIRQVGVDLFKSNHLDWIIERP
jgi:hypothetical protein